MPVGYSESEYGNSHNVCHRKFVDKSGDHVVKTDNDDVVLQRVNDIAFTISLNSAFQHIGDYGYQ